MKYPITLVPGGVIPRDPNMKIRLQRQTAAPATTTEATPATLDFLLAHFNGTDPTPGTEDVSDYHAEEGALVTVNVSFQDSLLYLDGFPPGQYALIFSDGYWRLADAEGALVPHTPYPSIAFRSGIAPATPDYLAEVQVELDPATDLVNVHTLMRCSRVEGDRVELQGVGIEYLLGDQGSGPVAQPVYEDSVDYSGSNTSGDPVVLAGGTQTVTLRTEVQGSTIRAYINGTLAMSQDFSDPALVAAGDLVFVFTFGSTPGDDGLYPGKILDMRAHLL